MQTESTYHLEGTEAIRVRNEKGSNHVAIIIESAERAGGQGLTLVLGHWRGMERNSAFLRDLASELSHLADSLEVRSMCLPEPVR